MNKEYGLLEYEIKNNEIAITGCDKNATDIVIPKHIENKCVTSIEYSAFRECALANITIPDSVTSIDGGAFYNCRSLTNITIPNSVTSIGGWAFSNCTSLENIIIPDSIVSIGKKAFADCRSLKRITIPDSVISVGLNAFNGCSSLKKIDGQFNKFPPKVEFINLLEQLNKEYCSKIDNV